MRIPLFAMFTMSFALQALAQDRGPVALRVEGLQYPILGVQSGMVGDVKLRAVIAADGSVSGITMISGPKLLADVAAQNLRLWRFSEVRDKTGQAGRAIEFVYRFRLDGAADYPVCSAFSYEDPYTVTVRSKAQHWVPSGSR
jgi:hypothetical protein